MAEKNNKAQSSDSKVFDIAKPENSKLETGSKPMVIGHKTLASDPSIREATADEEAKTSDTATPESEVREASTRKITIAPLSEAESEQKPTEVTAPSESEKKTIQPVDKVEDAKASDANAEVSKKDTSQSKNENPNDAEQREAVVEELIKSKKYFVDIKENRGISAAAFAKGILLVVLLAVVAAVALLYSGVVSTSVDLPFLREESTIDISTNVQPDQTNTTNSVEDTADAAPKKAFTSYSLETPADWSKETTELSIGEETYYTDTYTLPSGTKLFISQDPGGKGGSCEPAATDKPHQAGNTCPTLEILQKTIVQFEAEDKKLLLYETGDVVITREKFTDVEGQSTFNLCVQSYDKESFDPKVDDPYMGFAIKGCGPGIALKENPSLVFEVSGPDNTKESFFSNADVVTIERVLATLRLR